MVGNSHSDSFQLPRAPTEAPRHAVTQRAAVLQVECDEACMICLESARMSAAAVTGSIGSIFDVSMVGGGGHERSCRSQEGSIGRRGPLDIQSPSVCMRPRGGAPNNFPAGRLDCIPKGDRLSHLPPHCEHRDPALASFGSPYGSMTPRCRAAQTNAVGCRRSLLLHVAVLRPCRSWRKS